MGETDDVVGWANSIASQFIVTTDKINVATDLFVKQLKQGLEEDGSSLLQVPSYVTKLPNGSETGVCMAIDLGGTNLRVCSVELHGNSKLSVVQSKAAIPMSAMTAKTYKDLFRFIANHTESFMREHMPHSLDRWARVLEHGQPTAQLRNDYCHSLGFTFSFTFDQYALNKGALMYWTKAFSIEDAIGRDPCAMLQEALDERRLPLTVTALVNDTVGTLAARAYCAPTKNGTLLGAIFGTGTNGAYMERVYNIRKLHSNRAFATANPGVFMALNTEWGGFDRDLSVLPTTTFDDDLDRESVNPQDQYYEKRISGLYLGELLRRVILEGSQSGKLSLQLPAHSRAHTAYSIDSSFLSEIVKDSSYELTYAKQHISQVLGSAPPTRDQAKALKIIAEAIGLRAARLSAIAIAGVAIQSGRLPTAHKLPTLLRCWSLKYLLRQVLTFATGLFRQLFMAKYSPLRLRDESHATDRMAVDYEKLPDLMSVADDDIIDIGVDGSLFEFFPGFEGNLRIALREIPAIGPSNEPKLRMGTAKDGSGVGAALIALLNRENDI
ncbi:hexokinase [Stachybotrys elegans]|uniref:Phosphotransferase n=1 Tax=Stachybotrys elegans TaxID=80388 RepID=A0A8K0SPK2_9HYPO|nr:hexokinase [Stachybotrys elegans]